MPLMIIVPEQSFLGTFWWLLAIPIFVWFMIASFGIVWWHCPRCDRPFFTRGIWYGNLFAGACYHCGLQKWADPSSEARGA